MPLSERIIHQWTDWKLICVESDEYQLVQRHGSKIDFSTTDDETALAEAIQLINSIEGTSPK